MKRLRNPWLNFLEEKHDHTRKRYVKGEKGPSFPSKHQKMDREYRPQQRGNFTNWRNPLGNQQNNVLNDEPLNGGERSNHFRLGGPPGMSQNPRNDKLLREERRVAQVEDFIPLAVPLEDVYEAIRDRGLLQRNFKRKRAKGERILRNGATYTRVPGTPLENMPN